MVTKFATGYAKGKDSFQLAVSAAKSAITKLDHSEPQIVLLFAGSNYDSQEVLKGVKSVVGENTPIVGCTSSGEFTEDSVSTEGIVCALISSDQYQFFSGLGTYISYDEMEAVKSAVKDFPKSIIDYPYKCAMLLVDGLAGKGEEVVVAARSVLGPSVKIAGGAAADDLAFDQTRVFFNDKALTNAVSISFIASKKPIIITVKHGYSPFSPELKITKAKDNVIYEIDGQPALNVWKKYLRDKYKEQGIDLDLLNPKEISLMLLKYEAGLMTGDDYKIRFPTSSNPDGSLNFVCSMLEGSVIKIMTGPEFNQIESAKEAALRAREEAGDNKIAGVIVFDCACRKMVLEDKFDLAVNEMKQVFVDIPMIGFETYGEIAMEEGQLCGFHNATTVVMLILE